MTKAGFDEDYIRSLMRAFTHDLRNPLVNMQALSLQMEEALADLRPQCNDSDTLSELDESLVMMNETVARMNGVVDGGHRLMRAMYASPERVEILVQPLLHELVEQRCAGLKQCKVDIRAAADESIRADVGAVRQIVAELLDNACRYLPAEQGELVIAASNDGGQAHLTVSNNGRAVQVAEQERVFEPFFTTEEGRSGLGLTIVRVLAQVHGGRAWCAPGPTFHVAIPLS